MTFFRPAPADKAAAAARLRVNNFDTLRLVFASMVVVFHAGILSQSASLWWLHRYVSSTFAVQAFFVVSGFLVTMSFENSASWRSYAGKRLRRIAPAYVAVVVGAALLLSLMSTLPASEYFSHRDFWRYLGFNLMLSNFSAPSLPGVFAGNTEAAVNGSLWTIKVEVAFYAFVPFMVWAIRRFGTGRVLGTVFCASVAWKVGFGTLALATGAEIYAKFAKQLPGQLAFFAGGAWAYYRTRSGHLPRASWALIGLLIYAVSDGLLYELLAPVAVTAVVHWAAVAGPRLSAAGKYGDFSYGLYLYHFPMVQTFIALGFFVAAPRLTALIVFMLSCLMGVVSWFLIEAPSLKSKPELLQAVG
jgi:peptidoglycan/LPS O-acetylase OafA/YrhL